MKYLTYIAYFIFTYSLLGCKKDRSPLSWDTAILAPLVYGDLTISNLLKDSLITTNSDQTIQLKFSSNLYRLDFDSLVKVPDTLVKNVYTIPYSAGVTVNPGQIFVSEPEDIQLNINDVELTKLVVKGGSIVYSLTSNIAAEVIYDYKIMNALDKFGQPFSKTIVVPASGSTNSQKTGSFDLSDYTLNLRGTNGNVYNTLSTLIQIRLSNNHPGSLLINNLDSVFIENKVSNLSVAYAEGYFGNQHTSVVNNKSAIAKMNNIVGGSIDLEQVAVDFTIVNGIGVDAAFTIQSLKSLKGSSQVALTHPFIGTQNHLNRAYKTGSTINATKLTTAFKSNNSNIENWIENLPDSVGYSLDLEINPLGNVSGHYDFIAAESPFEINMDVDVPLSFLASSLTLVDTISINSASLKQVIKGKLRIAIENGFPLGAKLSLKNSTGTVELFSENLIEPGVVNSSGIVTAPKHSVCEVVFSEEDMQALKSNNQLIIQVKFDSPPSANLLAIYDYYHLKFNVVSDFIYQTSIK